MRLSQKQKIYRLFFPSGLELASSVAVEPVWSVIPLRSTPRAMIGSGRGFVRVWGLVELMLELLLGLGIICGYVGLDCENVESRWKKQGLGG